MTSNSIEWVPDLLGSRPRWITEPNVSTIEELIRKLFRMDPKATLEVSFFAQGGFNKLYKVNTRSGEYLIRVALPVDPHWKTRSEVATLNFVRHYGSELVPRAIAFSADVVSADNLLGFEWIIMEKLPGVILEDRWRDMSWSSKEIMVKTIANTLSNLFDHPLSRIGNIYPSSDSTSPLETPPVGRIVSMAFFWDKHATQDVNRGPFKSSHEWLATRLAFILNDATEVFRTSDDEDERSEAFESQQLAKKLLKYLPSLFPSDPDEPEKTVITHDDLSFHNLLVDDSGNLTGIIDWECVSALPLWKSCQIPAFLQCPSRADRPDVASYSTDEQTGQSDELYYEHLREWEKTKLREVFLVEMERIRPEWVKEYRAGEKYADFDLAVQYCDDEFARKRVNRWVDFITEKEAREDFEYLSLRSQLLDS